MEELLIERVIIPITECIPGMILMQSIVDEQTGTTIVGRGRVLTEESIEKLKNFEHSQVWIAIQEESSIWKVEPHVIKKYKSYAKGLKTIIEHNPTMPIAIKQFEEIADHMITEFKKEYELLACVNLVNELEKDDFSHSVNVAFLSLVVGRWINYSSEKLKDLVLSALLHDVGKLSLNLPFTHKKEENMNLMEKLEYKRHPIYGYEKLVPYHEVNIDVLKGVLSHHERCDGSGYPLSLREAKINDFAKIIGIVDTYDRLKEEYHIFEVVKRLGNEMIRKFDVQLLLQLCHNLANYYVGSSVLLNTGKIGEVAYIQTQALGRPILKINEEYVNLYEKTHLEIVKIL